MIRLLFISMALSLLTSCSNLVNVDPQRRGEPDASTPEIRVSQPKPYAQTDNLTTESTPNQAAVLALLERADKFSNKGDSESAAATIERALRITPSDAGLWNRLAAIRLRQGQPQQAEQLALRSNSLAGSDRLIQQKNWQLLARARWMLNDTPGALAAEEKARSQQY